jgi:neutral ceramidase
MTSFSSEITPKTLMRPNQNICDWLKRLRFTWVLGLCVGSLGSHGAQALLQAGAAAVDITPVEWPVYLRGSFYKKEAYSAHDPLHARAIVLKEGDTRLAIVIVDSCMVSRKNFDLAKQQASETTGIAVSRILAAATHTHSAPHDYPRYNTQPERAYVRQLINGIAQSVIEANQTIQPAEIGYASSIESSEVFNRRWFLDPSAMPANPFGETTDLVKMNPGTSNPALKHPAGPTDPEVSVLSIRTKDGRPIALLANYSLHYVGKTPDGEVSADYFGEFARLIANRMEREKPVPGFVGILSNGTSGDVNNIPFGGSRPNRESFEQIRLVAAKVADAAYRAYDTIEHTSDLSLGMLQHEMTLHRRVPTASQITHAKSTLKKSANGANDNELPRHAATYAQRVLDFAEECESSETVDILVQTIRIGDLAICTSPFETFAETGLRLKRQSPFPHTFTIELANGAEGYLPTPAQHKFGGYETWLPTNRVEFAASEKLVRQLLEMLDGIKD